jgi:MSHA biogenesis protein MshO
MRLFPKHQRGFTLIEMVMVIIVLGIIGSMVAVFMQAPVNAYFDTARRAALTDVADTAMRRMTRDLRQALPNSIRTSGTNCIEYIPTKTGGRYRADVDASGLGDILNFAAADTSFDMLGGNSVLTDQAIAANDVVVIYNLGIAGASAYAGDNTSVVSSVGAGSLPNETKINFASKLFPLASGSNRFHIVPSTETIVSYICSGNTLYRNVNYAYSSSCPAPVAGTTPALARNATACNFVYSGSDLTRNALVQISLQLSSAAPVTATTESVNVYFEVNVNNTP